MRGKFITIEGGEGSGKSTQIKELTDTLSELGIKSIYTREPGGIKAAEDIRNIILNDKYDIDKYTELLLFIAARSESVNKIVRPNLEKGIWVLSDRFIDSSSVYQGDLKGCDHSFIDLLNKFVIGDCIPDLTLFLDVSPKIALRRIARRKDNNKFDLAKMKHHVDIYNGYKRLAKEHKGRIISIDATLDREEISKNILKVLDKKFDIYSYI